MSTQRERIASACAARGWTLRRIHEDDGYSARSLERPGLREALASLAAGDSLVAAKLDRLSRSLLDFAYLTRRAETEGFSLVMLDLALDTGTPAGKMMVGMLAVFAEYERELIGQRTKDALAALRANGQRLGRPRRVTAEAIARILHHRRKGRTYAWIAADLNARGIPTGQGGAWHPSTVRYLANRLLAR